MWMVLVLVLGVVGSVTSVEHAFTSMNSMAALVDTEERALRALSDIIVLEENRLTELKRFESHYQTAHEKATKDVMAYVTNPINSYQLMKRLTADWYNVEALILRPVPNMTQVREQLDLPVNADLEGAAEGLCRLQETYELDTADVTKGIIRGVQYSDPMSAHDAWELGRQMYSGNDFFHAMQWFKEAIKLHDQEIDTDPVQPTSKATLYDFMAYTAYRLGNSEKALHLTEEYLKLEPTCERNMNNKRLYMTDLESMEEKPVINHELHKPDYSYWDKDVQLRYAKLCRGEVEIRHDLVCRYVDYGKPYLQLGKLKMEELNLEPPIVVFHEVISDSEIEEVKTLAQPLIVRSMVTNFSTDHNSQWYDRSRVSKTAFLDGKTYDVIKKLDIRAGFLANLDIQSAEFFQVLNYGIGGHYEPHYDYSMSESEEKFPNFLGNRIATLLFYMTDVEQGGATVFPELGAAVFPRKGSAVLWYNLFRDGVGDPRTRHGACPVLIGSKWACNKWFHEGHQEFLRPCLLESDSVKIIKTPVPTVKNDQINEIRGPSNTIVVNNMNP